jgi:hypothetical protein
MKNAVGLMLVSTVLTACGGGGGDSAASGTPVGTNAPPLPEVKIVTASIARYAAQNTSVGLEVQIKPNNFTPTGTLAVNASDPSNLFAPTVNVATNADGSYTLSLSSAASAAPGHYAGNVTLKLCADPACTATQVVPSVTLPYNLTVLASGSTWPGDNLTALAPWDDAPEWSTFQGTAAHTAYVPVMINPDQIKPRWKTGPIEFSFANEWGPGYGYSSTIAIANGMLYSAGATKVKGRKEFDGSEVWSYDALEKNYKYWKFNPPAAANGKVYMILGVDFETYLFAFDALTGVVSYKAPMKSYLESYLAPVALGDAVYVSGGRDGGLYASSLLGDPVFSDDQLARTAMWSPAVDGGSVYVYDGALHVVDRKTGAVSATIKNPGYQPNVENDGAPVLGASGNVFAADYANAYLNGGASGNQLMKFNTAKGSLDWGIAGSYPLTPAYAKGVVYAPNTTPYRIEARNETDGALLWSWAPAQGGETSWHGEPIVTNNLLFVSTNLATYAIDLVTHKVVWSYPAGGRLALSRSGILYIQSPEALVALNLK